MDFETQQPKNELPKHLDDYLPPNFEVEGDWTIPPAKKDLPDADAKQRELQFMLGKITDRLDSVQSNENPVSTKIWQESGQFLTGIKEALENDDFCSGMPDIVRKQLQEQANSAWLELGGQDVIKSRREELEEKKKGSPEKNLGYKIKGEPRIIGEDDAETNLEKLVGEENKTETKETSKHQELVDNFQEDLQEEKQDTQKNAQKYENLKKTLKGYKEFLAESDSLLQLALEDAEKITDDKSNTAKGLEIIKRALGRIENGVTLQKLKEDLQLPDFQNFDQTKLQSMNQNEAQNYIEQLGNGNYEKFNDFRNSVAGFGKDLVYSIEKKAVPHLKSLFEGVLMREGNNDGAEIMSSTLQNIEKKFSDLVGIERIEITEGQKSDYEYMEPVEVENTTDKSKDETVKKVSSPGYRFNKTTHDKIGGKSVVGTAKVEVYAYSG